MYMGEKFELDDILIDQGQHKMRFVPARCGTPPIHDFTSRAPCSPGQNFLRTGLQSETLATLCSPLPSPLHKPIRSFSPPLQLPPLSLSKGICFLRTWRARTDTGSNSCLFPTVSPGPGTRPGVYITGAQIYA